MLFWQHTEKQESELGMKETKKEFGVLTLSEASGVSLGIPHPPAPLREALHAH